MPCSNSCRLCDNIIISTAVNVSAGNVIINLPQRSFNDGEVVCVVVAQNIPSSAPIGANVFFSITGGTQTYQLLTRCCKPVTSCGIRSRMRYKFKVETTPTSAIFKMLGNTCCAPTNNLRSINGIIPTASATPSTTPTS